MATRPGQGSVVSVAGLMPPSWEWQRAQSARANVGSGGWRPNVPYNGEDGLKVTLSREKGLTPKGRLAVPLRFQCPITGDFARDWSFEWGKFNTLRLGERSMPLGRPLRTYSWSTLLLDGPAADTADFVVWEGVADPQRIIRELATLLGDEQAAQDDNARPAPFRLTVSQRALWEGFLVNTRAVLTSLRATQSNSDGIGVEKIDLTFDEYDPLDVGRKSGHEEREHTLKRSDSLYELAKKYLRSPSKWKVIRDANGIHGVSASSDDELWAWAQKRKKKTLRIPPT